MPDFNIKQNDTSPLLEATLKDGTNTVINLTGATVMFKMRLSGSSGTPKINANATVVDAAAGEVSYAFSAADTNTAGTYDGEFQITAADNTILSVPNNRHISILVYDDLD